MKTIKTKDKELLVVEVPKLAFYFDWNYCKKNYDDFNNPRIQIYWETEDDRVGGIVTNFKSAEDFDILGKLSELADEQCEEFVDLLHDNSYIEDIKCWSGKFYYNYKQVPGMMNQLMYTAKQSFLSLLQSEGIDTTKECLIIIINK